MLVLRRLRGPFVFASIGAVWLGVACADTAPIAPAGGDTQTTQTPAPVVRVVGDVTFSTCGAPGCAFQGTARNDGPGCVSNVKGVTHLLDRDGKEIEAQSWTVNGRMRPGDQESFTGCCFSSGAVNGHASQKTDVTFTTIQCI